MGKHSIENETESTSSIEKIKKIVYLENRVRELEEKLITERMERIEELEQIQGWALCNHYQNEKMFLNSIASFAKEKLKELKRTDQSNI